MNQVADKTSLIPAKSRLAPPRASAMIEALRGLGYSTATALADIIDNSISANARNVELIFSWQAGRSYIAILDDGCGMDEKALDLAMRLGERNPLEKRSIDDLGRFGLGMKTASFSQCRSLTVASKRDGACNCLRWDLDVLATSDDGWHLLEGPAIGSESKLDLLTGRASGTLVLWEHLDRIVTSGFGEQNFLDLVDAVERHLAMVFHRYLDGAQPRIRLSINGRPIEPWDPFLMGNAATWNSPVNRLSTAGGVVEVQCHVLPHKDRLNPAEVEEAGGPHGWTAQQGFYVYRNERLLVAGSWLGLGHGKGWTKEEAHRLARIRLDIPNSADADWKIDIRKSTAKPPVGIKAALTRLANDTRERARKVFAHRGQPMRVGGQQPIVQAWRAEHFKGGMRYRIDDAHPAIREVLEQAGELASQIKAMLRVVEETVPVQRIWLDTAEGKETPRVGFSGQPPEEVKTVLTTMYRNLLVRKGLSPGAAKERLLHTEPFYNYPDLVMALPDDMNAGD